ncbi:MAG TPA: YgiT-type zinc finger protein [Thermoanaerobaculia bacterium]|nr:YgiT-type zinc finger protein [Thermoanaerobaculia bacterium]
MSIRVRLHYDPVESMLPAAPRDSQLDLNETLPWFPLRRVRPAPTAQPQVRCIRCEGRMEKGTAPVHIERNGYRVAWDGLPAWVCTRCESSYFEENEVRLVQRALGLMKQLSARKEISPQ